LIGSVEPRGVKNFKPAIGLGGRIPETNPALFFYCGSLYLNQFPGFLLIKSGLLRGKEVTAGHRRASKLESSGGPF
jgi:hypothetical protein